MEKESEKVVLPEVITGEIKYSIKYYADGRVDIEYYKSLNNNMVCLIAARKIASDLVGNLAETRGNISDNKMKKKLLKLITYGNRADIGVKLLGEYLQSLFRGIKKNENKENTSK